MLGIIFQTKETSLDIQDEIWYENIHCINIEITKELMKHW